MPNLSSKNLHISAETWENEYYLFYLQIFQWFGSLNSQYIFNSIFTCQWKIPIKASICRTGLVIASYGPEHIDGVGFFWCINGLNKAKLDILTVSPVFHIVELWFWLHNLIMQNKSIEFNFFFFGWVWTSYYTESSQSIQLFLLVLGSSKGSPHLNMNSKDLLIFTYWRISARSQEINSLVKQQLQLHCWVNSSTTTTENFATVWGSADP